jgi:hypothetical protein
MQSSEHMRKRSHAPLNTRTDNDRPPSQKRADVKPVTSMSKEDVADLLERIGVQEELSPHLKKLIALARAEGLTLLRDVEAQLRHFIWLPNDHDYTIITLWTVYTHAYELFSHAPRLALHSPVPGSGKSTLFKILKALVREGKIWINPTEATLFRDMAATHPNILFDEMDKYLYTNKAILAVLNSGHMAGVTVPRIVGEGEEAHVVEFDVFGPVGFALKGMQLPADLADRSFRINMQRSPVPVEKLTQQYLLGLQGLKKRISEWTQRNRQRIETRAQHTTLPQQIVNRAGDNWAPLFAVAEAVAGEWPKRVAAAALEYEHNYSSVDRGILLLSNLRTVMEGASKTFFSSQELCEALNGREDWRWGEYGYGKGLGVHALARLLDPFRVKPKQQRITKNGIARGTKVRGYDKRDLEPVWEAYGIEAEASEAN